MIQQPRRSAPSMNFSSQNREPTMDKLTTRSMPVKPASFDDKLNCVRAVIATEDPTEVWDWEQMDIVTEVLQADGMVLPEGRSQVPLLDSHMRYSVQNQLGSVRDFAADAGLVQGTVFFDSTELSQQACTKAKEGHLTDLSAGYIILERYYVSAGQKAVINGREYIGPIKVVPRWMLKETSVTPIGAGERATFRASVNGKEMDDFITRRVNEILSARTSTTHEGAQTMGEDNKPAVPSAEEVRQQILADERARVSEINALAERHGAGIANIAELTRTAVEGKATPKEFWEQIRAAMKKPDPVSTTNRDEEPVITVNEVTPPWRQRAISILQIMTARAMGSDKLHGYQQKYGEFMKSYGSRAVDQEKRDAIAIVKEGVSRHHLSRFQEERTMSIAGGGSTGEYLLPAPFLAEIFVIIEAYGAARRHFRGVTMTSKTLDLGTISTKPTAVWATEASNSTAYDAAFGTGQLSAEKLVAITSWSSELEEDSAVALLPTLQQLMAEAIFTKEDAAGFKGDGTGTYGSFTGILNAATAAVNMDAGDIAFSKVNADYLKLVRDALSLAKRRGAMWFLHPDIISLVEGLKNLQGDYIFRNPGNDRPATLWGYPIADGDGIESMPALSDTAAATRFVAFGNPQWMLFATRRSLDMMVSREGILNTAANNISFNALQADGAILRMTERVAFKAPLGACFSYLKTAAA
jgi:HK97 family phage major capsid protein